ncbi:uncharacterized protein TNCV_386641 [Trichonephila clavipes]|nr:uncharacterized protein TNCV_386641 [Trichonephila clavipes]
MSAGIRVNGTLNAESGKSLLAEGCSSPVVNELDHGRHVMSSSPVSLKTRRERQRCTLNLSIAETSSGWCGVVVKRSSSSSGFAHVTWTWFKITWSVTKSCRVAEQCDVNMHSLTRAPCRKQYDFVRFHPKLEGENPRGGQGSPTSLSLPRTTREDL